MFDFLKMFTWVFKGFPFWMGECDHQWEFYKLEEFGYTMSWTGQPVPNYRRIEKCKACGQTRTEGQYIKYGDKPLSTEQLQNRSIH